MQLVAQHNTLMATLHMHTRASRASSAARPTSAAASPCIPTPVAPSHDLHRYGHHHHSVASTSWSSTHTSGSRRPCMRTHALAFPSPYMHDAEHLQYDAAHVSRLYSSLAHSSPTTTPETSAAAAAAAATTTTATSDNLLSRLLLTVLCHSLAAQLTKEGQTIVLPRLCEYNDFVRVSRAIMQHGRSTKDQEMLIRRALNSAIPGGSGLFRLLLGKTGGKSKWAAELNALFATLMFGWLVGDMELRGTEVPDAEGNMRAQNSVVHIKKCRYLEASSCVSSCLYLCKAPTQAFFTEEAGMPTSLTPDFQTLSCDIVFGQAPLPREQDTAFEQPCFAAQCSRLADQGLPSGHRAAVMAAVAKEC